jgi:hypothetical protein
MANNDKRVGRACGGLVTMDKAYLIPSGWDGGFFIPNDTNTPLPKKEGGISVDGGTIRVKISIEALKTIEELYESLKRASE